MQRVHHVHPTKPPATMDAHNSSNTFLLCDWSARPARPAAGADADADNTELVCDRIIAAVPKASARAFMTHAAAANMAGSSNSNADTDDPMPTTVLIVLLCILGLVVAITGAWAWSESRRVKRMMMVTSPTRASQG